MRALLDRELKDAGDDAFGHRDFARALRGLVESPENAPPFSVGLLGRWGTGKSSIKGIYLSSLEDDAATDRRGRKRADRFRTITFNAWRFGGENIKRALLREVYLKLGGEEPALNDRLFRQVHRTAQERRPWAEFFQDLLDRWVWSTVQVVVMFLLFVASLWAVQRYFPVADDLVRGGVIVALAGTVVLLGKQLLDHRRLVASTRSNVTRIELPSSSAEEYEDLLVDQLTKFKAGKTKDGTGKSCERLIVFVDDLDRLSAEEMVNGLDAIRTFMEMPGMPPEGPGLVFVVSCDEGRVADALADRRRQRDAELPGAVFSRADARRYLDRIFQFRLEIPQFPRRDMRAYARKRLAEDLPEIVGDLRARDVALENVTDRLVHVRVQDPRNVVHLLNAFSQSWWLAKRRELEGARVPDRAGGLQEGAVTAHPVALAAICALRVDYPDFFRELQQEPDLIKRFTQVFIRGDTVEAQPESTRETLRTYERELDTGAIDVKPEYRALRQYVSSLQGLRWPPSLQPLLLLAQDPVTRRLGDRALPVYDAFVSGDHRGVLQALGHDADGDSLTDEEMNLLGDMDEQLVNDTEVRQNNAGAVMSALADRFPEDRAGQFLGRLARRLADSPELRWRVGLQRMRNLLGRFRPDDRRELASLLSADLLKPQDDVDFRLTSGETPSLDEAMGMADTACMAVLEVWEDDGLPEHARARLLDWLETRRVALGGEEDAFPFSQLEAWMEGREELLLLALGSRYTTMLVSELEGNRTEDLDLDKSARRSRVVFENLRDSGEESRALLWEQAARFAAVRAKEAVALAWQTMTAQPGAADPAAASRFLERLVERLVKDLDDEGEWALDWREGSVALVEMVETHRGRIKGEAGHSLARLAERWGRAGSPEDILAYLALRLMPPVRVFDAEVFEEVVQDWSEGLLSGLQDPCRVWLAENFVDGLTEASRASVVQGIAFVSQSTEVTDEQGRRYRHFMGAFDEPGLSTAEMQGHLTNVLGVMEQQQQSPSRYLQQVFPALAPRLTQAESATAARVLQTLFVSPRVQQFSWFAWLHGQMADRWPDREDLGGYDPSAVFNTAAQVLPTNPSDRRAPDLLHSMRKMVLRGVVTDDNAEQVLNAACQLWPHYKAAASEALLELDGSPTPEMVAGLAAGTDLSDDGERTALETTWRHEAAVLGFEADLSVARAVLASAPQGPDNEPDAALRLWVDARPERRVPLLRTLLADPNVSDVHRRRVWLQAQRASADLGRDFILSVLPEVFAVADIPETNRVILDGSETVSRLFPTQKDKNGLSGVLLRGLAASTSVETKNGLAGWMRNIGGGAALRSQDALATLSDDDLEILSRHFPRSQPLRRHIRRRSS